jgi:hypothetical protein
MFFKYKEKGTAEEVWGGRMSDYKICMLMSKHNQQICELTRDRIHNTSLSSLLKNEPKWLEYYITLGWKDLPVTNALA